VPLPLIYNGLFWKFSSHALPSSHDSQYIKMLK
jgi:hypothetical protein